MADAETLSTVFIAIATGVNVVVAFFQWRAASNSAEIARQVFESANRPYAGLEGFEISRDRAGFTLRIDATIKNFGSAPAEHFDCSWDVFIGGVQQSSTELSGAKTNPMTLFPGGAVHLKGALSISAYLGVMDEEKPLPLEIIVRISYKWQPSKSCTYNEKHLYNPENGAFVNLGEVS